MKTHKFDGISFIAGLVLFIVGIAFLVPYRPVDLVEMFGDLGGWLLALFLLGLGLVVLAPAVAGMRGNGTEEDQAS